jgi:solute carrier family 25 aspartate/glutamate transporter 12/13
MWITQFVPNWRVGETQKFFKATTMSSTWGFGSISSFQQKFEKNAVSVNGEKVLQKLEFRKALAVSTLFPISEKQGDLLFAACNRSSTGYVTLPEFLELEKILQQPDGAYQLLSRLISGQAKGEISGKAFKEFFSKDSLIDFNSPVLKSATKAEKLGYEQVAQLTSVLKEHRLQQFFLSHDSKSTGFVSTCCVVDLLQTCCGYRKDSIILKNVKEMGKLSFPEFSALFSLLEKLDWVESTAGTAFYNAEVISQSKLYEALNRSLKYSQITPLEVDILCRIAGSKDQISMNSLIPVFNPTVSSVGIFQPVKLSAGMETLKSIYNFTLGSIAGAIGAFAVYPIGMGI